MNMDNKTRIQTRGFLDTFHHWPVSEVSDDWVQELYNYFIKGYPPGSFHSACFENNLYRAACTTHLSNQWTDIAAMMKWLGGNAPLGSWGSHTQVVTWLAMSKEDRDAILLKKGWIITDEELAWKLLEEA